MKLNLGCADRNFPGYLGVDIAPPADVVTDLRETWPWGDNSAEEILAFDLVEHLPDRIHTMNEAWRVLRPGGLFIIEVPNAARGAGFAQDPTHTSQWCMNSFQYYEAGSFAVQRLARAYGITARFKVASLTEKEYQDAHEKVWKITAHLIAIK